MQIRPYTFNPFAENTYLIIGSEGNCLVVDPGMMNSEECEQFDSSLITDDLTLTGHLLTHAHIDHVLGVKHVQEKYGVAARSHPEGKPVFEACPRVAEMYGIPYFEGKDPDYNLRIDTPILIDNEELEVRFVPGHAPGHVVFIDHASKQIIAGDTLFQNSIGRTDLPGGDHELLLKKIREELFTLEDDYIVWPGHGPSTTIGHEKSHNPFLR